MATCLYSEDFCSTTVRRHLLLYNVPLELGTDWKRLLSYGDSELGTIPVPPTNSFGEMETVGFCRNT